jgi:peptidoglycan-N-acetylglucosamine deacetylase
MRRLSTLAPIAVLPVVLACSGAGSADIQDVSINGRPCTRSRPTSLTAGAVAGESLPARTLALTFDDGPAEITTELSAFLRESGVQATFFVNGTHVAGREDILDQTKADGHLIANHTQTHAALTQLGSREIVDEVELTDQLLARWTSADKLFFRPPFGDWSEDVFRALSASPMKKYQGPIGWDVGDALTTTTAADWDCWDEPNGTRTVEECGALYLQEIRTKTHGIVLMHDGPPAGESAKTLAMVKQILPALKAEGFRFARVDELGSVRPASAGPSDAGTAAPPCR